MRWILDDLKNALAQLRLWQTWVVLGLIALFATLAWAVSIFALRTDELLIFLHRTAGSCESMTNGIVIFMIGGMIFFMLATVLTLGEIQQFFEHRRHADKRQARQSLMLAGIWGIIATSIAVVALSYFLRYCR